MGPAADLGAALACCAALAIAGLSSAPAPNTHFVALRRAPESDSATVMPISLAPAASTSIGASDRSFWPVRHGSSLIARAGGVQSTFSASGATLRTARGTLGLSLAGVGRGHRLGAVPAVAPSAAGNQVLYRHASISEYYRNGPYGLEQGFTVRRRPGGRAGPLVLTLGVRGSLIATQVGSQVLFGTRAGKSALRYGRLSAVDASGHSVPAHMRVRGKTVELVVDDGHASYPLRVDPFVERAELTGAADFSESGFGQSVALSGDGNTALVGAPGRYPNPNGVPGSVTVFTRTGSAWAEQAVLKAPPDERGFNGEPFPDPGAACFGSSVAVSYDGNTALVGAPCNFELEGEAFIFTRSGSTWTKQRLLNEPNHLPGVDFSRTVALSSGGATALIGDHFIGAFAFTGLSPAFLGAERGESFTDGNVALSGDGNTALVEYSKGYDWAFSHSSETGTWSEQAKLPASGRATLSFDGNTALVGNKLFTRSGDNWTQQTELPASGWLLPDGDGVLAGDHWYVRSGETWTPQAEPSDLPGGGETGALSSDGNTALIGGSGAAFVFANEPAAAAGETQPASSVTQTSATLNATVNPDGGEVSECKFEYGFTASYGTGAPCSSLPGSGESPVVVSAMVARLKANTTYHFRVVATNPNGTSYGEDREFTTLRGPEVGRCVTVASEKVGTKTVYRGGFKAADCVVASATKTGRYEWEPGVVKRDFKTSLSGGAVTFATTAGVKVTCTTEEGSGEYRGTSEVVNTARASQDASLAGRSARPRAARRRRGNQAPRRRAQMERQGQQEGGARPLSSQPERTLHGISLRRRRARNSDRSPPRAGQGGQNDGHDRGQIQGGGRHAETGTLRRRPNEVLTASLNGEKSEQLGVAATVTQVDEEAVEINAVT